MYFRVILCLLNKNSDEHTAEEIPAGYYKSFWIRADNQALAIELAEKRMLADAEQFESIVNPAIEIDNVQECTWWEYLRSRKRTGRTFF